MADSLLVAGQIELIGSDLGVPSTLPQCPGAVFTIDPDGMDLGSPQPVTDIVTSLVLDGQRPFGTRADNRSISLPIQISAPDRLTLAAAREVLLQLIDQQTWTLTWTRDGGLPLILDCFRASPSKPVYDLLADKQFSASLTISFEALPYGRSASAVQLSFASPATGTVAPPSPVTVDDYSTVSGEDWTQSSKAIVGSHSARWAGASSEGDKGDFSSFAFYEASVGPLDITGRTALSVWAGLGSDQFTLYQYSGIQQVTFAFTLTDAHGHELSFGTTTGVNVGASGNTPVWNSITASIPSRSSFDYTQVTGYSVTIYNYTQGGSRELLYLIAYLDDLTANPATFGAAPGTRAAVYTLFGIQGTSHAPLNLQFEQTPVVTPVTDTLTGSGTWLCPAGVTQADVAATGGGGAGAGLTASGHGGGGGGGSYAEEPALALTPGTSYAYSVGAAGTQGASPADGGATTFAGDDTTVAAAGGQSPAQNSSSAGAGGAASANTIAFAGGSGAAGTSSGGGGGGHAATQSGPGLSATGTAGAGTGPGHGGSGNTSSGNGNAGTAPGGGGGGANTTGTAHNGGAGAAGTLTVTYNSTSLPTWQTLIAHRPGPDAPASLCPYLTVGNGSDVPNGSTEYLVTSLVSGVNARFGSTYSIMLTAASFASSGNSRTVTVTVVQHESSGGSSSSWPVSRTFTPSLDAENGMIEVGNLTLPGKDMAPDNTAAYFGVTVQSTNTGDRFLDVLFVDTLGQLVWVDTSITGYSTYYVDEPPTDRSQGRVMGSPSDRTAAVSVLGDSLVSGGPLFVDPPSCSLLVYSMSGAPALVASYAARYFIDRIE